MCTHIRHGASWARFASGRPASSTHESTGHSRTTVKPASCIPRRLRTASSAFARRPLPTRQPAARYVRYSCAQNVYMFPPSFSSRIGRRGSRGRRARAKASGDVEGAIRAVSEARAELQGLEL